MKPRWIDFHCHLDLYREHTELIRTCELEQIAVLTMTTTPKAWRHNRDLANKYVRPALGFHPQLVAERANELALWKKLLPEARFVGEVGLDAGPKFYSSFNLQKSVFAQILQACADAGGKVLSIHSIRCAAVVLEMIEKHLPAERGTAVLHWFMGTKAEVQRAVALNCFFSVNIAMLKSLRGRELIATLPLDRILTETDGPFIEIDGRATNPVDIPTVVAALAHEKRIGVEEFAAQLVKNWTYAVGGGDNWSKY